jgi:hypothetical protein
MLVGSAIRLPWPAPDEGDRGSLRGADRRWQPVFQAIEACPEAVHAMVCRVQALL